MGTPVDPPWNEYWTQVSFTTSDYIFNPEHNTTPSDATKRVIDQLLLDVSRYEITVPFGPEFELNREEIWDEQRPIYHHRPENFMNDWWITLYPRLAWEFCFWFDRGATSSQTNEHMTYTTGLILQYYHNALRGFCCAYMLPHARAVRERVMGGYGQPWTDEACPCGRH